MIRVLFALLLAVSLACPAGATVLVPADLGDLAREAVAIARGRIAAVDGTWTDDRRAIETLVTLDVDTYLKGSLGATLRFKVPGGELGRYRRVFVGAPEFSVGDRVVLFLGAYGPSVPHILGLSQGVFRLMPSHDGSGWLVTPPPILPAARAAIIVRGDAARRPMPLADFERHVRALAAGAR